MTTEQNPSRDEVVVNPPATETAQAPVVETPKPSQPAWNEDPSLSKFKSPDDLAKSYKEVESSYSRTQNAFKTAKEQVESQTKGAMTMDDKGNLIQNTTYQVPATDTPAGGAYDTVYDPYTGQAITNPIDLQLSKLPLHQRIGFVTQAVIQQNQKWENDSFQAESETLTSPEAKGFEEDVRKVMRTLQPQVRANKEAWKQALLQVKGARYDSDIRNKGTQAVDEFVEKAGVQNIGGGAATAPSGGGGLPPDQEKVYQYWKKADPGRFKDRAEFTRFSSPGAGR